MNQGLTVILPLLLFAMLDLVIVYNVYKYRNNAGTRTKFLIISAANFVQQLLGAVSYMFDYHLVSAPAAVQYMMYLCLFTAMSITAYGWFMYLRMLLAGKEDLSVGIRTLIALPVDALFLLTAVSPWTHWIFWIGEDGVYRRGSLCFMQYVCTYIYVIFAIGCLIYYKKRSATVYRKKVYGNFIIFILPAVLGSVLQLEVVSGGYSMIGMSIAVIFLYLNLYVDEVNENQRLQLAEQDHIVMDALSASYLNVYLIDTAAQAITILKLNGYVTGGLSKEKSGPYPYEATCRTYIGNRVYEEDQETVAECMSLGNLLRQLKGNKEYEFTYRVPENGGISYYQGKYVAVREGYIVCGFQNIDEIVKKEKEQKAELQSACDRLAESALELEHARDEAQAANTAKTSFLFNMSHDIRTPMNAIMGFRDLLEKHQDEPEKRQDYLNKIRDSSAVLLSIINNVLEMARIEKGTLEIEETACSAEQFNDTLYDVFRVMMEEKGLAFTRQIEVQHHYVYCDTTKLREIFINILGNAYKYTNAGSVHMHLEEIPCDREGWALYRTTISDTGIGMSEEFLPHLFEEFSREQNTTDAKVEGTGLGMPIVRRLVEMMDGTIEVKSKKGVGSTFIVTIPHKIADKPVPAEERAGAEIDPKLFEGRHILLAEDNDLNAEIAMEILGEAGFIVDRAEDGRICVDMLERAEAGHYDVILMDIQMPNMNGYEATKAIRQLEDRDKADIRILAMTANAFEEDKREAFRAGMDGHLAKPIHVNELLKTLAGILK